MAATTATSSSPSARPGQRASSSGRTYDVCGDQPENMGLAGLSNHRNYWRYGYDAVMTNDTSFPRNPNYHQPTDTLDFPRMVHVVNGVFGALPGL